MMRKMCGVRKMGAVSIDEILRFVEFVVFAFRSFAHSPSSNVEIAYRLQSFNQTPLNRRQRCPLTLTVDSDEVCLLGVGKSCLLLRFSEDSFTNSFITTIGIDFKIKTINVDNKWIRLQIWDTAGQERFRTITSAYYRKATGILLVYDVADEGSFKNVRNWVQNIQQHANDQVSKILIGNKSDMKERRVVPREKGEALAKELGIPFIESSAKTGENVTEIFTIISREVMKRTEDEKNLVNKNTASSSSVRLSARTPTSAKAHNGCCT